jgi:DNA gyrase subunit A
VFIASTHDYLLVFLNDGRMHWLKVYDIPSMARQSKGRAIVNLLDMKSDDKICAVVAVRQFDDRFLVAATRGGQIKKTELVAYSNPRRDGIRAAGLKEGDVVIGVAITRGNDDIVLATRDGQAIRFKETDVRPMGRTAAGVRGINLRDDDQVVGMAVVDEMATLMTICENGHGKRTDFGEYRVQSRGGYGIINIRTTERNGMVVGMMSVRDNDEMMLITQQGKIVRVGISDIRTIGRATQGVRIIAVREGDTLVSVAKVASEEADQKEATYAGDDADRQPDDALAVDAVDQAKEVEDGRESEDIEVGEEESDDTESSPEE